MKKVIICILILGIVAIIWGQSTSKCCKLTKNNNEDNNCREIIESLQLCVDKNKTKLNSDHNVIINVILKNLGNQTIEIPQYSFEKMYTIKIYNPSGNLILSKSEKFEQKVKEGKASMEEMIESIPINSSPRLISISSKQEIPLEFNLSQYYDFTEKGKYKIEISMRLQKKDETSVAFLTTGAIEIEIE
jgi:hypothetical protein